MSKSCLGGGGPYDPPCHPPSPVTPCTLNSGPFWVGIPHEFFPYFIRPGVFLCSFFTLIPSPSWPRLSLSAWPHVNPWTPQGSIWSTQMENYFHTVTIACIEHICEKMIFLRTEMRTVITIPIIWTWVMFMWYFYKHFHLKKTPLLWTTFLLFTKVGTILVALLWLKNKVHY